MQSISEAREKAGSELTDDEKQRIQQNIMDLLSLSGFSIPTLKISGSSDEESVADIFVRVNSGG